MKTRQLHNDARHKDEIAEIIISLDKKKKYDEIY